MSVSRTGPAPVQCPHCGKMLNEDDLYCRYCGKPMVATGFDEPPGDDAPPIMAGRNAVLRGIGDRPSLSDPLATGRERRGALDRFNTGSLGCAGILGILVAVLIVIAVVAWFAIRPQIADDARDGVHSGLARELSVDNIGANTTVITLDNATINTYLSSDSAWFDPLDDLSVNVSEDRINASFKLYGLSGSFSSQVTVQDGQVRLIDPKAGGAGGRLIRPADIARAIEQELTAFTEGENRQISTVSLKDGSMVITFAS